MAVFMADEASGKAAVYDIAPGGGAPDQPTSMCNRPLLDPITWLSRIYFHSDFNYLEVAATGTVTITHPLIGNYNDSPPAAPAPGQSYRFSNYRPTAIDFGDHLLLQHNLGYVPRYKVAVGNEMIAPGFPAQLSGGIGTRWVVSYATTTQIRLKEFATRQAADVPAIALSYQALAFSNQPMPIGNVLFDYDQVTNIVRMGRDRFVSNRRYIQVVPGGSPFALSQNRNVDLANGVTRVVTANGNIRDSMVAGQRLMLYASRLDGAPGLVDGAITGYNGSFTGSPSILIQAP